MFNGPEIRRVLHCSEALKATFNTSEAEAWSAFCQFVSNFLGNNIRSQEYVNTQHCGKTNLSMGCTMSLKFHFLITPRIQIAVSDEHGERFYQDMESTCRHQGKFDAAMMGDYSWSLVQDADCNYKQQSAKHF